jgi:hypothetical protein
MICLKCRALSPQDARFCNSCGSPLDTPDSASFAKKLNVWNAWGKPGAASQRSEQKDAAKPAKEPEHLIPWLIDCGRKAIQAIPHHLVSLAIYAGIVLFINLVFWTANVYSLPAWLQPVKGFISLVVFLTATYNDIIPKTVFWVLLFTFGKKLVKSMRKKGFGASFACLKKIVPEFKASIKRLGMPARSILLVGAGIGLAVANNFASYSRFSGARNKMDKYFIVLIMAFAISYLLGEANKTGVFRFLKLGTQDVAMLLAHKNGLSDDGVTVLLSGFIAGLILDAPLILLKWMYGGYIMGLAAVAAGIVLIFIPARQTR